MVGAMDQVTLIDDFSGGVNNVDLIGTLQDNEVTVAENFDITSTGRLVSRPPIVASTTATPIAGEVDILGWFLDDDGVYQAVISSVDEGKTWLESGAAGTRVEIAPWAAADCVQYGDRLYLCRPGGAGAKWMHSPTPSDPYTLVSVPTMPAGSRIIGHKGRLWVASGSTVYYSQVTNISGGTTIDDFDGSFVNVSPGDGQHIVELDTSFDDVLIIRNGSTWLFSYDTDLAEGSVTQIDGDIGADSWRCVARYQDSHIVLNGAKLYRLTSRVYYPLHSDRKMALRGDGTFADFRFSSAVTVFGERALVWRNGTMYALHLSTSGWTTYISESTRFAHGYEHPAGVELFGASTVFGVSGAEDDANSIAAPLYRVIDRVSLTAEAETYTCRVRTKAYAWNEPTQLKRLFSWGLDAVSKNPIRGRAIPLALTTTIVTYDQMNEVTYDTLNEGTWDYPLVPPVFVEGIRDVPGSIPVQVYVRMPETLWFRQLAFEVELTTDGSTGSAPCRIESIATIVGVRNRAPAAVN